MKRHPPVNLEAIAWDAMEKYGFKPRFPNAVIRETSSLEEGIPHNIFTRAKDLRGFLWSSVDNWDSMDLDQIEYCERGKDGEIHVWVAIADVDQYVPRHSGTDRHAGHNGTSVYTDIITFPMLPDILSKGISSLLPGKDHLAVVIEYLVSPDGKVKYGEVCRAIVSNKAKLVYEEVGDWLSGTAGIPDLIRNTPGLEEQVLLQYEAACRMRKFRTDQGALELDTLEARTQVEHGQVKDIIIIEKNPARCLIEDFMVAANRTMMAFLENAGVPVIERIVRTPRNWPGIMEEAKKRGARLPDEPDALALARFLLRQKEKDPVRFPDLSLTVVKLMGPGEYVLLEPEKGGIGHFALAVTDYTHATAPNRRYVDLIIQRLVKSVIDSRPSPYAINELTLAAAWLTDREKASKKVERFMRKAAAAVLLQHRIGETFHALVTGAADKGTYVRIISPPVEGRVVQGEQGLFVGQEIRVRLLSVDPYHAFIDFARAR